MATTTNYGWDTPDDTDLVKDGAAAIRTLGSSVDTTTKALNPSTTEGDIEYRSSTANTNSRLAIGTAGQVLQVNSGATAPEWATSSSGGMTLLSTTTLSGTSTTISSINQTYNNLVVLGLGVTWSSGNDYIRVNPNSVSVSGSYSGVSSSTAVNNTSILPVAVSFVASNANTVFNIEINNYTGATHKPVYYYGQNPGNSASTSIAAGTITTTSAISSIQITTNGGTATLGGTVLIYGVK